MPIDCVLFCDTGIEFPQMYEHIQKVEKAVGIPITRVKSEQSYEYLMLECPIERKDNSLSTKQGGNSSNGYMVTMTMVSAVTAFAEGGGGGGAVDGEAAFNQVIGFFATWIGRIGLVVAFVGGVMFALAIKNDDAEAKTRGLMTLASGFVVFALTLSLNLFGITA